MQFFNYLFYLFYYDILDVVAVCDLMSSHNVKKKTKLKEDLLF